MSGLLPCPGCCDLESRVAQLERRFYVACEVCDAEGVENEGLHANCFNCCRNLCAPHLAQETCPNNETKRHTPRSRP